MRSIQKLLSISIVLISCIGLVACQGMTAKFDDEADAGPSDPFDYNYCGGVPVYPVIGVTFSTQCGPRNQIVLGRYGTLMWIYPAMDGKKANYQGTHKLTKSELKQLSLLAEVTQLADPMTPEPGQVNYQIGINFSGRDNKRIRGVIDARYSPALELMKAMRELVPGKPELPDCHVPPMFFDPVVLPGKRRAMTLQEMKDTQGQSYANE